MSRFDCYSHRAGVAMNPLPRTTRPTHHNVDGVDVTPRELFYGRFDAPVKVEHSPLIDVPVFATHKPRARRPFHYPKRLR